MCTGLSFVLREPLKYEIKYHLTNTNIFYIRTIIVAINADNIGYVCSNAISQVFQGQRRWFMECL